ncbi:MAG: hypothetical protein N2595_04415, partial [bacterium]|nr:hypothetical protein [bacterium]
MNDSSPPNTLPAEANFVEQKLIALVRRAAAQIPYLDPTQLNPVQLTFTLHLDPKHHWQPVSPHLPLLRQIQNTLDECSSAFDAFQPGRVYCYRSRTPWCPEALPPKPTAVFAG